MRLPPPEEPTGGIRAFAGWSKNVAAIAGGLAAVGVVAWWLAKAVFVTRDEYVQHRTEITRLSEQVTGLERSMAAQSAKLETICGTLADIRVKLAANGHP
jgi:hypothetical protein